MDERELIENWIPIGSFQFFHASLENSKHLDQIKYFNYLDQSQYYEYFDQNKYFYQIHIILYYLEDRAWICLPKYISIFKHKFGFAGEWLFVGQGTMNNML